MDAEAEGHVRARRPGDVEAIRVGELRRVAVGRGEDRHHHRAFGDGDAGERDLFHGATRELSDRPVVAEDLLDEGRYLGGIGAQLLERPQGARGARGAIADEVGCRLVAGDEQEDDHAEHVVLFERAVLRLAAEQVADQVVAEALLARRDLVAEIGAHLAAAPEDALDLFVAQRAGAERHVDGVVGPALEVGAASRIDAEHLGDDGDRQRHGQIGHHVEPVPGEDAVDVLGGDDADALLEAGDGLRGEGAADELAELGVHGRIAGDDVELAKQVAAEALVEELLARLVGLGRREDLGVLEDVGDVRIAADDPVPERLHLADRRLFAELGIERIRVLDNLWFEEVVRVSHGVLSCCAARARAQTAPRGDFFPQREYIGAESGDVETNTRHRAGYPRRSRHTGILSTAERTTSLASVPLAARRGHPRSPWTEVKGGVAAPGRTSVSPPPRKTAIGAVHVTGPRGLTTSVQGALRAAPPPCPHRRRGKPGIIPRPLTSNVHEY